MEVLFDIACYCISQKKRTERPADSTASSSVNPGSISSKDSEEERPRKRPVDDDDDDDD